MRFVSVLLLLIGCAVAEAQQIEAVPNTPVAYGDQLWVVRDGKVIERYTNRTFTNGNIIDINGTLIGEALCPPRREAEPPIVTPPPFELPKDTVPELPVPPVATEDGPNLLQIVAFVAAVIGGYYVGKKSASDDEEADDAPDAPVVA